MPEAGIQTVSYGFWLPVIVFLQPRSSTHRDLKPYIGNWNRISGRNSPMARIQITNSISLLDSEIEEKFVRSGGPGGQNVNKVATAVQLRFNVPQSDSLPERVKAKILDSGDSRLTKDGELVLTAERFRTQEANRQDALERLKEIIRQASHVPRKRIATRPTLGSKKRRLESKSKRGSIKKSRSGRIELD